MTNGGNNTMNAMQEKLFFELRQSQVEIENSLKGKQKNDWITTILEEELADICLAINKIKKGNYGQCEISGEFLPEALLKMIPTLKSIKDSEKLELFRRKQI